jgi:glycosyltransferase involved in cell wall biosynthesis
MNKKISVVILTKNEEKNIQECIESVPFADEVVVLDDNSDDNTRSIAEKLGAKVFRRTLDDFATQRNYALTKASCDWVLFLDADERVSKELGQEIVEAIGKESNFFYKIPRKNKIFGKYLEHTDWYPDFQFRLFEKGKGTWDRKVHEQLKTNTDGKELSESLSHNNYQSIQQFIDKNFGKYADYEAELLTSQGYFFKWRDLLVKPTNEFLRRFFASKGYKDGIHGLVASILVSFATFVTYAKIWEKGGFKSVNLNISDIGKQFEFLGKDIKYWIKKSIVENEKNRVVRFIKKAIF